jgi:hypothetical protein
MIHYLRALVTRLRGLFGHRRAEQELDDEIEMRLRLQDVRYGLWMLIRNPGFTFVALLTLALGIGANTAIFSVVNAVLLKPLPYYDPQGLFWVTEGFQLFGEENTIDEHYFYWQAQSKSFDHLVAYHSGNLYLTGRGEPERLDYVEATANLFPALGVAPQLGRVFAPEEHQPGSAPVAILSHAFWQRRFGGDPAIIGQAEVGGISLVVRAVGDPLKLAHAARRQVREIDANLPVMDVMSMEQRLAEWVEPRRFQALLFGLFAALALVIATVGIYGVISYAVSQRMHEIGIRMALGAQASDVLRMVIWRGMRLALIGVALGLAASLALTRVMKNLLFDVSATDPATFALIALLLVGVALIASYIPARRATKVDPLQALRHD